MEIVLAVLLLFGGFTLGSISAGQGEDDGQSTLAQPDAGSVPDSHPVVPVLRQSDWPGCHSDRAIVYRDLTVPYAGEVAQQLNQVGDCEADCSDD